MKKSDETIRIWPVAATTFFLLLIAAPSKARFESPAASPPTQTSITLSWTAPGDDGNVGQASQYDLRYSTQPITSQNFSSAIIVQNVPAPLIAGSSEEFAVTGLDPGTLYYFALKAADEVPNWSGMSNVVSQTTANETSAPGNIVDLTIDNPTASSLTLHWTAPGDDGSTGTAAQYDIRYFTSPITASNWDSAVQVQNVPAPNAAGSAESILINGLTASTMYYFAVKTADEVPNWSEQSNVANAQTAGDQVPPATIDDLLTTTGPNDGELVLEWTAPGDDGWSGTAAAYEIRYSTTLIDSANFESSNIWTDPPAPQAGGQAQQLTLTGLVPGELYYVAIRSYDDYLNRSGISNIASDTAGLDLSLGIDDQFAQLPDDFSLSQNYPNPFNPTTIIEYSLPTNSTVSLAIYNLNGQLVKIAVNEQQPAGYHSYSWESASAGGASLASGVYLYRLKAGSFSQTNKMILLK